MAYVIGRKVVKDSEEFDSYAYGITLPIKNGEGGFFEQAFTSLEQARANLKNLLLTARGERVMQPEFGSGLKQLLFEPIDETFERKVANQIIESVSFWLPYITIEDIEIEEVEEDVEVPFAVIENVPVFPGCERGNNEKKRKCMSEKIAKFVQRKFNTDLAGDLGLTGRQRISVIFKIDKSGNVTGVRARAPHPRLEKEAQRVINLLPKMQPGKQRGKAVIVPYSLPIIFQVQD